MRIGFIGSATWRAMALNLIKAAHAHRPRRAPRGRARHLAQGASGGQPQALARESELVLTSLPGPRTSRRSRSAPMGSSRRGGRTIYADLSTARHVMRKLHAASSQGVHVLDAPVSGG